MRRGFLTENELAFIRSVVELEDNINKARKYIKENYNIDSTYNEEDESISVTLITNSKDDELNILAARKYLEETIPGLPVK